MVDTAAGDPRTGGRGERLAEPGYALAMASLALQVVRVSIVMIRRPTLARAALPGVGERGATRSASLGGPRGASGIGPHPGRRTGRLSCLSYRGRR